jgi:solute carrier family 25 aspartate/glutamate transporter 12/13
VGPRSCLLSLLFQDFHEEYACEAFRQHDKDGTGFISPMDFFNIMKSIKSHLLTEGVAANLVAVSLTNPKETKAQIIA